MADKLSSKSTEFVESNFSTLNAHAEGVIDNEKQLARLKRFKADRALIKNICIILLVIGVLALLLAVAYNRTNAPIIEVVEKPVYIDKPVYETVKIPDPELSQVIEVPVYIEKIIKVPIQVGNVTDFTFFNSKQINKDGIAEVTVGASYESVNSLYPEEQWCYATGTKNISKNIYSRISLANKAGLKTVDYNKITEQDSKEFGSSIEALEKAKDFCEFFPTKPPIEGDGSIENIPLTPYPKQPPSGGAKSGTGFYVNNSGYVITNNHVVDDCSSIWIDDSGEKVAGTLLRKNSSIDIAAIKVDKKTKSFAQFGEVRTGEDVMALGFPLGNKLGEDIKATKGNVSALSGIEGNKDYLQFTAPIQPGNSGGPLLNEGGLVVGINTANLVGEGYQNINFAIKGSSAQNFLGKHGINFTYGSYNEPLKSADIVEKGEKYTVRVLCFN